MSDQHLPFFAQRPTARRPFGNRPDIGFVPSNDRPTSGEKARGVVTLDGTWLVATFSHRHLPFVRAIKSIHGAHEMPPPKFDTSRMSWLVHIGNVRQVRHLSQLHGWEESEAVKAIPDMDPGDVPLLVSAEGEQLVLIGAYREETWKVLSEGGATYERRSGRWFIPYELALDVIFDLQKLGRIKFVGDRNDLMDRLDEAAEMLRLSRALKNTSGFEIADTVTRDLHAREFQIPGVEYLTRSVRAFAWATTGAGKTTVAAVALEQLDAFPALIIPPSGLKTNWVKEFAAILPDRSVHVCEGRTPAAMLHMPDVWICNYDVLHYWCEFFMDVGLLAVIADEGHRLANPSARWTKAAIKISESMPYEAARFILTATPVRNRRADLAPQLAFIGREGEFGDKKQLREDERLSRRMRTVCAWRPDPKEVLVSLGVVNADGSIDPVENRISIDGDPKVMAEYREAEANIWAYLTGKAREKAIALGKDPESAAVEAAMKLDKAQHLMVVNTLVGVANRAKIKPAREWIGDFEASGDKILVFAERVLMMDALHEATGWPQIRGGVKRSERDRIVEQFQGTGEDLQGIILQYQSGGEGLTLTEAYHVLHAELRWSPGDHLQADGRAWMRMNDPHNITAHYLVCAGTIDEVRMDVLDGKRAEMAAVTDGDRMSIASESTFDDVLSILLRRALGTDK